MRTSTAPTPTNYAEAAEVLAGRNELQIAGNTWLWRIDEHTIAVALHDFDIIDFNDDGTVVFEIDGRNTPTTRERLNRYAPDGVMFYDRDGVLYVRTRDGVQEFGAGITLDPTGRILVGH